MLASSLIAIYSIADRSRRRGFMPASLNTIVQAYLNDTEFLEEGRRIEQFYTFLEQERTRFQQENRPRLTNASLGNCALFISLFAHWLDWTGVTVIYYTSLLIGLKMLIDAEALPTPRGMRTKLDR